MMLVLAALWGASYLFIKVSLEDGLDPVFIVFARIALGDSAEIQIDAFPDTTFVGRVVEISNSSVKAGAASQVAGDQAIDYEVTIQLVNAPVKTANITANER